MRVTCLGPRWTGTLDPTENVDGEFMRKHPITKSSVFQGKADLDSGRCSAGYMVLMQSCIKYSRSMSKPVPDTDAEDVKAACCDAMQLLQDHDCFCEADFTEMFDSTVPLPAIARDQCGIETACTAGTAASDSCQMSNRANRRRSAHAAQNCPAALAKLCKPCKACKPCWENDIVDLVPECAGCKECAVCEACVLGSDCPEVETDASNLECPPQVKQACARAEICFGPTVCVDGKMQLDGPFAACAQARDGCPPCYPESPCGKKVNKSTHVYMSRHCICELLSCTCMQASDSTMATGAPVTKMPHVTAAEVGQSVQVFLVISTRNIHMLAGQ